MPDDLKANDPTQHALVDREKLRKFPRTASHETYIEPEPILDPTCGFEEMDRGEGMAVDDEKTYHRTEK
jgi:hypothetical protein